MLLDSLKRNENPVVSGWTKIAEQPTDTGRCTEAKGWENTGVGDSGMYWSAERFREPRVTITFHPEDREHSDNVRIWACYSEPGGKENGYDVLFGSEGPGHPGLYSLQIRRYVAGEETTLASAGGVPIPGESAKLSIHVRDGKIHGLVNGEPVIEAKDTTFTEGYAGIEEQLGGEHTLPAFGVTNFEVFPFEEFPPVNLLDSFKRPNEAPVSDGGLWEAFQVRGESEKRKPNGGHLVGEAFGATRPDGAGEPSAIYWTSSVVPAPAVVAEVAELPTESFGSFALWACVQGLGEFVSEGYTMEILHTTGKWNWRSARKDEKAFTGLLVNEEAGPALSIGDKIGLTVIDGFITLWHKAGEGTWTEVASYFDTTYTTGFVGMQVEGEESGRLRNFEASSLIPQNTAPPTITGIATQGFAEEEHVGSWINGPFISTTWQWKREGVPIEGATGQEYVPTAADVGHTLTVVETVANSEGSARAESAPTPAIKVGIPTNLTSPTITGPAVEGEVELEGHGAWSITPTAFAYQWFLCDAKGGDPQPIEGAHRKTYVPLPSDVGHTLRVSEVAFDGAGESAPALSLPSPIITATAATRFGLPPTQPDVPEPVLRWPFRMAEDESHIPFIEQDTVEEYEQCVALVLTARPNGFPDEPDFGLPDPTFAEGGVTEADLSAVIRKWEPRAHIYFTLDELVGIAQEVDIEVKAQ